MVARGTRKENTIGVLAQPRWLLAGEIAAALCLIVQCRSIWMHLAFYGSWVNRGVSLLFGLLLFAMACFDARGAWRPEIDRSTRKTCLILALYCILFVLVNPIHYRRALRCGLILILLVRFVFSADGVQKVRGILLSFKYLMAVVAGVSVLCWVFLSLLHVIPYPWSGNVYVDWSDTGEMIRRSRFLYIYFETQWFITRYVARNSAIFVEGPMANYCFSLALMMEVYLEDHAPRRVHRLVKGVLIAAILTTFTTTGYLLLLAMGILSMAKKIRTRNARIVLFFFVAVAIGLMLNKLTTDSASVRFDDVRAGINAWLDHPFFGVGFENHEYVARYASYWRLDNLGYSNSPLAVLSNGGIFLAALYGYALLRFLQNAVRHANFAHRAFLAFFLFLFTVTIIPYQYITMLIILMLAVGGLPFRSAEEGGGVGDA